MSDEEVEIEEGVPEPDVDDVEDEDNPEEEGDEENPETEQEEGDEAKPEEEKGDEVKEPPKEKKNFSRFYRKLRPCPCSEGKPRRPIKKGLITKEELDKMCLPCAGERGREGKYKPCHGLCWLKEQASRKNKKDCTCDQGPPVYPMSCAKESFYVGGQGPYGAQGNGWHVQWGGRRKFVPPGVECTGDIDLVEDQLKRLQRDLQQVMEVYEENRSKFEPNVRPRCTCNPSIDG